MKILEKIFSKESSPLNFDSILIVTYGRSGSTLLQGVLNTIGGVIVRGENYDTCFHLFQAYEALMKVKQQHGKSARSPFFGAEKLNVNQYIKNIEKLIKDLLLGKQTDNEKIRMYGFKEIRYMDNLELFDKYLDFLTKVFPNVCFIFNTRIKEDVIKSWKKVNFGKVDDENKILELLSKTEKIFLDYMKKNKKKCFHITYEDVIEKSETLKSLYNFLGAEYHEQKINKIMAYRHSYKPYQTHIDKLPN